MEYIIGNIKNVFNEYIILECNNIGYKIFINISDKIIENKNQIIYIYEKYLFLNSNITKKIYGFLKKEEKELFKKMISIKGIDPINALNILKIEYDDLIKNIILENYDFFIKNHKKNKNIIEALIKNIKIEKNNEFLAKTEKEKFTQSDLFDSLKYLGYSKKEINNVIFDIDLNNSMENLVKSSIEKINKKVKNE